MKLIDVFSGKFYKKFEKWTLVDALQKKFKGNRNESKVKVETSWKEDGFGFPLKLVEMALART